MVALPHCDDLFLRYFDRWYNEEDRKRKGFKATRPDVIQSDSLVGLSQYQASGLSEDGQKQVLQRIDAMVSATQGDWPSYLNVAGKIDLNWIEAFDCHYDKQRISEVIKRSDPEDFSNDYVVLSCEFGSAIGHVMRSLQPRLVWRLDWPYWESALLDPKSGNLMPVFHWAIKKMSDYGWDDGFAPKINACLQLLDRKS
jgi:hypothetical protein